MSAAKDSVDNSSSLTAGVDLAKAVWKLHQDWSAKHKRANILIAGKTGVGKSTLINTVFRDNLAVTGMGRPVTQSITEITKPGVPLTIIDTKGLELADYDKIKNSLLDEVTTRRGEDVDRYIHLAWICISEESARVEDAELDLGRALAALGVAVVVVLTKVSNFKDNDFERVVREQFKGTTSDVLLTRSLEEELFDDEENRVGLRKVRGIDELLSVSWRHIPESQRQSFANSLSLKHKKAVDLKRGEATLAIGVATAAAGTAAASPIPFSDALLLVPIQVAMITSISKTFGMTVTRDAALPIVTALLGASGATLIGRTVVSALFKFVPGIGSVIGGTISAGMATTLTSTMGIAYADVLAAIAERGESLDLQNALKQLKTKLGVST